MVIYPTKIDTLPVEQGEVGIWDDFYPALVKTSKTFIAGFDPERDLVLIGATAVQQYFRQFGVCTPLYRNAPNIHFLASDSGGMHPTITMACRGGGFTLVDVPTNGFNFKYIIGNGERDSLVTAHSPNPWGQINFNDRVLGTNFEQRLVCDPAVSLNLEAGSQLLVPTIYDLFLLKLDTLINRKRMSEKDAKDDDLDLLAIIKLSLLQTGSEFESFRQIKDCILRQFSWSTGQHVSILDTYYMALYMFFQRISTYELVNSSEYYPSVDDRVALSSRMTNFLKNRSLYL